MPEQYNLAVPTTPVVPPPPQNKDKLKLVFLAGVPILFLMFFFGLLIGRLSAPEPKSASIASVSPTPTPPISQMTQALSPSPASEVPPIQFLPNKQYFDDTYVVITKSSPHQTLILSISRVEQERNFSQYTKVNFFDGKNWDRKSTTTISSTNAISINTLLRGWNATSSTNPDHPLQLATVQLPTQNAGFTSNNLQNEISIQSTPGSTKFIYQGDGTMTLGSDTYPAYVFYSRTYSFNASALSYLAHPDALISDWLIFWDKEGTFYYLDDHKAASNSLVVAPFLLGLQEDVRRVVNKTTDVTSDFATKNGISSYHVTYKAPSTEEVLLPLSHTVSKSDKKSYSWITDVNEGTVVKSEGRVVQGVGVVEYIRQN